MKEPSVEEFVQAVREYCALAEREAQEGDLEKVRGLLLRLMFHVPALEKAERGYEREAARPTLEQWKTMTERFSALAFDPYWMVFDPHSATDHEAIVSCLSDDLADIYGDLAEGLDNFDHGYPGEAYSDWATTYSIHWARHIGCALMAIETHRAW